MHLLIICKKKYQNVHKTWRLLLLWQPQRETRLLSKTPFIPCADLERYTHHPQNTRTHQRSHSKIKMENMRIQSLTCLLLENKSKRHPRYNTIQLGTGWPKKFKMDLKVVITRSKNGPNFIQKWSNLDLKWPKLSCPSCLKVVQNLLGHPVELGFFEPRFWHSKSGIVVNNLFPNLKQNSTFIGN